MRFIEPTLLFLLLIITLILLLLLPAFCLEKFPLPSPHQGSVVEDKMRLGSTPPNCHNHCNRCNPCTPVQVPTQPTRSDRTGPDHGGRFPARRPQLDYDRYSNYKPLGWKCRCNERLYDP